MNHEAEKNNQRKDVLKSQNISYINISQVKIKLTIHFFKRLTMHFFQIPFHLQISYDIICISAPVICSVYVTAYSMKGVEMFTLLSNMRVEFRFVYSRHQTDVWDKEQNAAVPRGVCSNPFQTFKVQACKCRSCTSQWFPFLKVLSKEVFLCSLVCQYI